MPDHHVGADYGAQLRSSNLSGTPIYRAIGLAEGTIDVNGQPTRAYYQHGDPGNGHLNKGFGSYQVYQHEKGERLTPQEADRVQADRLAEQWTKTDDALTRAGFSVGPQRDLIAACALDSWNQSPLTLGGHYGLLDPHRLELLKTGVDQGKPLNECIANWRTNAYHNDQGTLEASGFKNDLAVLKTDQLRRVDAVSQALGHTQQHDIASPPSVPKHEVHPQHATPSTHASVQMPANAHLGADVAASARSWAGQNYKPGERERCQDFVNHVLDQAHSGLSHRIGTTQHAVDGLPAGTEIASRFAGRDVSTPIADLAHARPGDIVCFTNTYGHYPPGTVTHVGVYVGNNQIVDRPTADRPVQERSIDTFGKGNYQIFRPIVYGQVQSADIAQSTAHHVTKSDVSYGHGVLRQGDASAETLALQKTLKQMDIRGLDGRPLVEDGKFGDNTKWAVKAFQRVHGLEADGEVGAKTRAALFDAPEQQHAATARTIGAAGAKAVSNAVHDNERSPNGQPKGGMGSAMADPTPNHLDHPAHPDHEIFHQSRQAVYKVDAAIGRASNHQSENFAAAIAVAARSSGLKNVDHVVLSDDGSKAFAVQGQLRSADTRVAQPVDTSQAVNTSIAQSTSAMEQVHQRNRDQALAQTQAPLKSPEAVQQQGGSAVLS